MNEDINLVNLEILRMAKELVVNEYTDRRAQEHNKWLKESEEVWRNKQVKLPYPDIPPYPTEMDIIKRARTLFAFLKEDRQTNTDSLVNPPRPKVPEWAVPKPEPQPQPEPIPPQEEPTKEIPTKDIILNQLHEKEMLLNRLRFGNPAEFVKG